MTLTLVTMLFDVARRTGVCRRSIQEYLEQGKNTLGLDQDMVIYCDLELAEDIKKLRNPNARTEIIASLLEEVPQYKWIGHIKKYWPVEDKIGRTPEEVVLLWSRPQLICDVATRNPFNSTHVGSIDIGITHIVPVDSIQPHIFNEQRDKVKFHILRYINKNIVDAPTYYCAPRGLLAGGYFVGPVENIKQLAFDFNKEIEYVLSTERVAVDEDLFARIIAHNPEKYLYSYGRYNDIFSNHCGMYSTAIHFSSIMAGARDQKDWQFICDMGAQLLKNYYDGTLKCEMLALERILEEYFIGAYWLEYPNQTLATEIAHTYNRMLMDTDFYNIYMTKKDLTKSNFAFLRSPPTLP